MITLHLPMPPSVNQAYRNVPGVGRVKTDAARKYEGAVLAILMVHRPRIKTITGDVVVSAAFGPRNKRRDLDNCAKLPLDALVKAGVIEDDRHIVKLTLAWDNSVDGCVVTIGRAE